MPSEVLKSVNNYDVEIPGLKIISKIGEGGMSVVYLAEQISLKREVAVKVIRLEIANNDLDVQRFKNEAKTIAHLDHPNIINIYSIGQTIKGEVYFTMPYLYHGDLSNYVLEDEQEFIYLLQSVCDGLSFAHDRGVVHRDIKPENLLFDKFGNVCIADFGIAITKDGNRVTKEHQVVGSAQYMSPEQARSKTVDVYSDIYSLGIVIYERLTGQVPFDGEESISILVNHVSSEPPPLPAKMRHWQTLIDKCLAKSPEDRFQSMVELKIELNKMPVNSLQRTNRSIKQFFVSDKPTSWLLPLFLFACVAFFGIGYSVYEKPQNNDAVVQQIQTDRQSVTSEPLDKSTQFVQVSLNEANELKVDESVDETTIKASIDEIKQQLLFENKPNVDVLMSLQEPMTPAVDEAQKLLSQAINNIASYQLLKPANNNATDQLLKVLALQPGDVQAIEGLKLVARKYYYLISSSLDKKDFDTAIKHTKSLLNFQKKSNNINDKFEVQKQAIIDKIAGFDVTVDDFSIESINQLVELVSLLAPQNSLVIEYQKQIAVKSGPQIGDELIDNIAIKTVVVSKQLAVSPTEVTVAQYQKFAEDTDRKSTKCRHKGGGVSNFFNNKTWEKPYFKQQPNHPVSCVSMEDAMAYITWLNETTQLSYRLLSLGEFQSLTDESITPFEACETGNIAGKEASKLRNKEDEFTCDDQHKFTAPVAMFTANKLGIYDLNGNVSEWVNCGQSPCQMPVAVSSSWLHGQQSNNSTKKEALKANAAFSYIGFRVVRDL